MKQVRSGYQAVWDSTEPWPTESPAGPGNRHSDGAERAARARRVDGASRGGCPGGRRAGDQRAGCPGGSTTSEIVSLRNETERSAALTASVATLVVAAITAGY